MQENRYELNKQLAQMIRGIQEAVSIPVMDESVHRYFLKMAGYSF